MRHGMYAVSDMVGHRRPRGSMIHDPKSSFNLAPGQMAATVAGVAAVILAHADELTSLDQMIGDGDHGLNMRRGAEALLANVDDIASRPLPDALGVIGRTLVMTIGGASGPLFGTLAMALGQALGDTAGEDPVTIFGAAFGHAIEAVKLRGRSDAGHKTLLDVLAPVHAALTSDLMDPLDRLPDIAALAAQATIAMKAQRGRAAYLGTRSIGHMDPGARSTSLIIGAICHGLKEHRHG
jgi:phosphoenolpyruvate---glycerone phosphotransferase subunit DhaL